MMTDRTSESYFVELQKIRDSGMDYLSLLSANRRSQIRRSIKLYMVPESHQNNSIDLYKCKNFPLQGEFEKTPIPNIRAVDATLVEKDDKWWLFANSFEKGGSSWDMVCLYMAGDPLSDRWSPKAARIRLLKKRA